MLDVKLRYQMYDQMRDAFWPPSIDGIEPPDIQVVHQVLDQVLRPVRNQVQDWVWEQVWRQMMHRGDKRWFVDRSDLEQV